VWRVAIVPAMRIWHFRAICWRVSRILDLPGWAVPLQSFTASGSPRLGAIRLVSCLTIGGMLGRRHLRPRSQATRQLLRSLLTRVF
jgi:hypothetical protein